METFATASDDKRGIPRVQKLFMTAYLPKDDGPTRTPISLGRTVDISPSGVGMEIYKEVAVGTAMELEIDLEALPLAARGKVVRVEPLANGNYLIGISFDEKQELLQTRIAFTEIVTLRRQLSELTSVLAEVVRSGWPWDDEGRPGSRAVAHPEEFAVAMRAARKLLAASEPAIASLKEPQP